MLHVTTRFAGAGPCSVSAGAVAVGSEVYVFGNIPEEVHVFNTLTLRWRKLPPPPPGTSEEFPRESFYHTAVLIDGVVYVFGGCTCSMWKEYNEALHAFDVVTHRWSWPEVSGSIPPKRMCHSACVSQRVMFVFGGCDWSVRHSEQHQHEDVFRLDTATMAWTSVSVRGSPPPPESIYHGAAILGTKMFVFGEVDPPEEKVFSVFDIENDFWLRTPPARLCPETFENSSGAVFTHKGELYMLEDNHVWRYFPEICSWTKMDPKGKKTLHWQSGMSACVVGDRIVLFGRVYAGKCKTVTYVLEFSPSLKTLCKLAVIEYGLDRSELPHDVRWELTNMTTTDSD